MGLNVRTAYLPHTFLIFCVIWLSVMFMLMLLQIGHQVINRLNGSLFSQGRQGLQQDGHHCLVKVLSSGQTLGVEAGFLRGGGQTIVTGFTRTFSWNRSVRVLNALRKDLMVVLSCTLWLIF